MRKTKFWSQALTILLAIIMVASLLPVPAYADYNAPEDTVHETYDSDMDYDTDDDFPEKYPEYEQSQCEYLTEDYHIVEYPTYPDEYPETTYPEVEYPEAKYPELEYPALPEFEPDETLFDQILPLSSNYVPVFITFEGYNLGHGFYAEPHKLLVPEGISAAQVTFNFLTDMGHTFSGAPGTGFFLDNISGFNRGFMNPPAFIPIVLWDDTNEGGTLGSSMYSSFSGWMYSINHIMYNAGADDAILVGNEVIRWQFSVYGFGADLGLPSDWGGQQLYDHADKTELIRALFTPNIDAVVRQAALDVIIDPLATPTAVANALSAISGGGPITPPDDFWFEVNVTAGTAQTIMAEVNNILSEEFGQTAPFDYSVVERLKVSGTLANSTFNWTAIRGANALGPHLVELDLSGLTDGSIPSVAGALTERYESLQHIIMPAGLNSTADFSNKPLLETITWAGNVTQIGPSSFPNTFFQNTPSLTALIFLGDTAPNFSNNANNATLMFSGTSPLVAYVPDNTTGGYQLEAFFRHFTDVRNLLPVESPQVPALRPGVPAIATDTVVSGNEWTIDLSTIFVGAATDILSYTVSINGAAAIPAAELFSYTPTSAGAVTFVFTSSNGTVESETHTVTLTVTMPSAVLNITAPTGATVQVFRQGNFHQITPLEKVFSNVLDNGTTTFGFPAGGTHYRVSMDGKITRTGFTGSGNVTIEFEDDENPQTQIHSVTPATLAQRMEASTMVNVNTRNHLTLDTGETFRLRGYRAAWEIINGDMTNMIVQPDFHVNVLLGSDIIDIASVPNQSNWFDITAQQTGTAIIEVYYDAIRNVNAGNDNLYAATNPVRRSVVVITVDGDTDSANFGAWDTEFDTVYYLNTQDNGYFPVDAHGISSVEVAHVINGVLGSWQSVPVDGGSYDVPVSAGNNVVRVTGSNGRIDYQVVRAAQITPILANLTNPSQLISPGDRFTLRFEGLFTHAPKLGNVYNPTLPFMDAVAGNRIGYTFLGTRVYAGDQYRFINMHTMTFTAPNVDGHFYLTDGNLPSSMYIFSTGFGLHRTIGDDGVHFTGTAPTFSRDSSILPDVPITIGTPTVDIPEPFTWRYAMSRGLDRIVSVAPAPQFGQVGGDWAVMTLARAGHDVPTAYFETYLYNIGTHLMGINVSTNPNEASANRVYNSATGRYEVRLTNAQSTENARLIVALTSLGVDASSFYHNGVTFDLVARLGQRHNYTATAMWGENQGINGPIWNLIALSSRGWDTPYEISDRTWVGGTTAQNPITLDERIGWILGRQLANGGWALTGTAADPDVTAMVLQALAPHRDIPAVATAIDRALVELSRIQFENGGWGSWGTDNVQSVAQVIVALTALGIDPQIDSRFVKPDGNPITAALRFFDHATGGFIHGGSVNLMATEQAVYSLVAYWRFLEEMNALYDMGDAFAPPVVEVNKDALNTVIANAQARVQAGYTPATWAMLQAELAAAILVLDNAGATQAEVDATVGRLNAALNALVPVGTGSNGGGGNGSGGTPPPRPRISLTVLNPNARPGDPMYFLQGGAVRQMYLYIDYQNETAYSILHRPEAGLQIRSNGHPSYAGMYVEAINGWSEFDGGPYSGWMFAVNNVFHASSASLRTLQDGDRLYWLYTYELGADLAIFGNGSTFGSNQPDRTDPPQTGGGGGFISDDADECDDEYCDEENEYEEEPAPDPEAEITEDMLADSEAVAEVIENLLRQAYEYGATGITIIVPVAEGVAGIELELIVRTVRETADEGLDLTIRSDIATITLDTATLAGIARGMDDDEVVRVVAEITNTQAMPASLQQQAIGSNTVIRLVIMVGDTVIENFDGLITVSIPYTPSVPAENHDLLTVYHVDSVGNIREMPGARYESSNITFTTSNFSLFFISEWISPFTDVSRDSWYLRNVRFVYSSGLMIGTAHGQFSPDTQLSRAMMVTLLWRLEGEPVATSGIDFHDVTQGSWYTNAIAWASANGIVSGHGDGTFAPGDSITREQIALIFQNYVRFGGADVFADAFIGEFTDADSISAWAVEAMMWANESGLITGRTLTTLAPDGTATRAEVAGILQRFLQME